MIKQKKLGVMILVCLCFSCKEVNRPINFPLYEDDDIGFVVSLLFENPEMIQTFNIDSTLIYSKIRFTNSYGFDSIVEYSSEFPTMKHITNKIEHSNNYSKTNEYDLRFDRFKKNSTIEETWYDAHKNISKFCVENRSYCREFSHTTRGLTYTKKSEDGGLVETYKFSSDYYLIEARSESLGNIFKLTYDELGKLTNVIKVVNLDSTFFNFIYANEVIDGVIVEKSDVKIQIIFQTRSVNIFDILIYVDDLFEKRYTIKSKLSEYVQPSGSVVNVLMG